MDYVELDCLVNPKEKGTDIVIAALSSLGFESFEETDAGVKAYIQATEYDETAITEADYLKSNEFFEVTITTKTIKAQNWNAVWEKNFEPVKVGVVGIRAPFHAPDNSLLYDIVIEPKMSFGTGHHETTALMVEEMISLNLKDLTVLDMGSGTGILAILASMLGAKETVAIDFDEWAYSNAIENVERNKAIGITVICGTVEATGTQKFDCILANINRNILLKDLKWYCEHMNNGGVILMSGFLDVDLQGMKVACEELNLTVIKHKTINHWTMIHCIKRN
jgi:ribosomal protein L11 methyltransferase